MNVLDSYDDIDYTVEPHKKGYQWTNKCYSLNVNFCYCQNRFKKKLFERTKVLNLLLCYSFIHYSWVYLFNDNSNCDNHKEYLFVQLKPATPDQ